MRAFTAAGSRVLLAALVALAAGQLCPAWAASPPASVEVRFKELEGNVQVLPARYLKAGEERWFPAKVDTVLFPGDRVRSGSDARGLLKWSGGGVYRFGANALFDIEEGEENGLHLLRGIVSFFHREKRTRLRVLTPGTEAGVDGTEFVVAVETVGGIDRTTLSVIDGLVHVTSGQVTITLTNRQQAVAIPGQAPLRTPGLIIANDVLQWALYYPAVLDPDEIPFTPAEQRLLAQSLGAYRDGNMREALASYPTDAAIASDAQRVYYAALLLAAGEVQHTEDLLAGLPAGDPTGRLQRLASALRRLIAAVKFAPPVPAPEPVLASEFLAASYYAQSRRVGKEPLAPALEFARKAEAISQNFGYAAARVADLEFSFGRVDPALDALNRSLVLAPRNPQAYATQGFLLAAQNKIDAAIDSFDHAIALDGALGNAWLGRGLVRIKRNHLQQGQEDLLVAAGLEPQRAFLRSYLGKAYADVGDTVRATKELGLGMRLDPGDPTAWLYSALLNQQDNRINQAIRDLEHSKDLNKNRSLYRSSLELDQDLAVRSANLAGIFKDNNMTDESLREAARAVNTDYANYSAHLFLANSYDQLRDPNFVNLRLETAASSEYLIANLLAPVGGGILNSAISQQEYSRLFDRNRLGVISSTEYLSRGAWIENGAQYGIFDTTSYSIGAFYRTDPGQRANEDVEQRQLLLQVKQQLSPKDTVYVEASQLQIDSGDLRQYYNNVSPFPELRIEETQEPILTLGYHREWSPGQHTLVSASWLNDEYRYRNPFDQSLFGAALPTGGEAYVGVPMGVDYKNRLEVFSIEPQHIWQEGGNVAIVGGRYQAGDVRFQNVQIAAMSPYTQLFSEPAASQDFTSDLERLSVYAYDQYEVVPSLWLTAGIAYDRITFPDNLFAPPFSTHETTEDQFSPKAGLLWTAPSDTTVRFAYTRSLTGATLEQSVRIEPTQVAGFNQTFRGLIPESVAGSIPGAKISSYDLAVEQKLGAGTYLGIAGQIADLDARESIGAFFTALQPGAPAIPSTLIQNHDYEEKSVRFSADQLIGQRWSLGIRYQLTYASYTSVYPQIADTPAEAALSPQVQNESLFHQVGLLATFNHPWGFFSQFEADWYSQSNHGFAGAQPGDTFWQLNVFAGYRFPHRRAEIRVGLLNLTDTDYHLSPLTFYSELPRARTFTARIQFSF